MQAVLRMVVLKVMYENDIDVVRQPGEHAAAVQARRARRAARSTIAARTSCCCAVHRAARRTGDRCARRLHADRLRAAVRALTPDKKNYVAVTGTVESRLPHPMPISMMVWGGPGTDPDVINVASAYEAATHHRVPPPAFGPLSSTTKAGSAE